MRPLLAIFLLLLSITFSCSDKKPTTPIKYPDQIPPARIGSLWICNEEPTWADICWYAPGDDSLTGKATAYEIRFGQSPITDSSWDSCEIAVQTLIPRDPTVGERFRLTGLDSGSTYFVAIKAVDDIGNWSRLSNVIVINAIDTIPPNPVVDLIGRVDRDSMITLRWTVPSDPESDRRLSQYDIRFSPYTLTNANWATATPLTYFREPALEGHADTVRLRWVDTTRYLFFGLKVADQANNISPLSNVVKILAPGRDIIPIDTADGNDSTRLVWEVEHGGHEFKSVNALVLDSDGEMFLSSSIEPPPLGSERVLAMKFDSSGGLLWATPLAAESGLDVSPDGQGGCFVFGSTASCNSGSGGGYIAHVDGNGAIVTEWCYQFPEHYNVSHGLVCLDGGFALAGTAWVDNDQVAFIIKISSDGVEQWRRYPFQENMCPGWGEPPLPAFASGGALSLSADGQIMLGTSFSYSDHVTITGCGFQWTHLMLIEFDPSTADQTECQVTAYPDFPQGMSEIVQFQDGRFGGLIGAEYFITDPCRTSSSVYLPADQQMAGRGAIRVVPGLPKSVIIGLKAEPAPVSNKFDFSAMVLGESGIIEQRLIWGDSAVTESSPVVAVLPNGAITVAGLRAQASGGLTLVISRIRFRL